MKKRIAFVLALALALTLAACSMPSDSSAPAQASTAAPATAGSGTTETAAEGYHIGYAAPGLNSEFNMMIYNNLTAACEAQDIKLDVLSCEGDVSLQVQQIENFITMDVDSLIAFAIDPPSVNDALKKAKDSGIHVVVAGPGFEEGTYDVCLTSDEILLGEVATQNAADWIDETFPDAEPGSVKVAVLGFWYSELNGLRCDVMCDIASYTDKAVLVESYDIGLDNFATACAEYVEVLLQQHPDINCIISYTDTFAIIADEILMQRTDLDFSKIGQFTVDGTQDGYRRIMLAEENQSTIRATAVSGLDITQDMVDACLGKMDDKLDENKTYFEPITAIRYADIVEQGLYTGE